MSLSSLVQLPVDGDNSQEWILGIKGAGRGGEQLSDWLGLQSESPCPQGTLLVSQNTGNLRAGLQGLGGNLMYGKGSPSPIPGNAPDNPTKWAELGYQCLHLQMWKVRLAPKNLGDLPHSVPIGELTAKED